MARVDDDNEVAGELDATDETALISFGASRLAKEIEFLLSVMAPFAVAVAVVVVAVAIKCC